jgi:hypothetical protein
VDDVKMDLVEIGWGRVDWVGLAQGRNKWRALVNTVTNRNYREAKQVMASRLVLSSIELVIKALNMYS